jgi:hypothetical protein
MLILRLNGMTTEEESLTTVFVRLRTAGGDQEEWSLLASRLRQELLALDVEDVRLARGGEVPQGAKGDPITTGTLVITASAALLPAVGRLIRIWLSRDQGRNATFTAGDRTLKVTSVTAKQQQQIIDEFLKSIPRDSDS